MIRGVGYRQSPDILDFDDGNGETVDFDDDWAEDCLDDQALRLHLAQGDHLPGAPAL